MREIKFRAWDKLSQKMCFVDSIEFRDFIEGRTGANVYTIENKIKDSRWLEDGNFELMQYTGLKDKYGVEIYEGDMVSFMWKDPKDHNSKRKETFCRIAWNDNYAAFTLKWLNGYFNNYFLNPSAYEVKGNIHQHPELLK